MSGTPTIDVIIKLGGSAVTDKETFETLKPDALKLTAQLLRKCFETHRRCIIVHGAGSFGHHQAKQFSVNAGFAHLSKEAADTVRLGFCQTHRSVRKLNQYIVENLLEADVPVIPCSPCSSWLTSNRSVTVSGMESVVGLLGAGFVPLLHGDAVQDTKLGGCILSGDTIIKNICSKMSVERVVFLSDVDGVYDKPPQNKDAQLLQDIYVKDNGNLTEIVETSTSSKDVTGGIRLKLQTAADIVVSSHGRTRVFVCKLGSENSYRLCLGEEKQHDSTDGTEVHLQP